MLIINTLLILIVLSLRILSSLYVIHDGLVVFISRYILYKDNISQAMFQSIYSLLPVLFNLILFVTVKDFVCLIRFINSFNVLLYFYEL